MNYARSKSGMPCCGNENKSGKLVCRTFNENTIKKTDTICKKSFKKT